MVRFVPITAFSPNETRSWLVITKGAKFHIIANVYVENVGCPVLLVSMLENVTFVILEPIEAAVAQWRYDFYSVDFDNYLQHLIIVILMSLTWIQSKTWFGWFGCALWMQHLLFGDVLESLQAKQSLMKGCLQRLPQTADVLTRVLTETNCDRRSVIFPVMLVIYWLIWIPGILILLSASLLTFCINHEIWLNHQAFVLKKLQVMPVQFLASRFLDTFCLLSMMTLIWYWPSKAQYFKGCVKLCSGRIGVVQSELYVHVESDLVDNYCDAICDVPLLIGREVVAIIALLFFAMFHVTWLDVMDDKIKDLSRTLALIIESVQTRARKKILYQLSGANDSHNKGKFPSHVVDLIEEYVEE
jgi:hypothetical protein